MSTQSFGAGSGRAGAHLDTVDGTVAGVATRVVTSPPQDSDWGAEAPPNGTMVWEADGILWVRLNDTWRSAVLL